MSSINKQLNHLAEALANWTAFNHIWYSSSRRALILYRFRYRLKSAGKHKFIQTDAKRKVPETLHVFAPITENGISVCYLYDCWQLLFPVGKKHRDWYL